MERIKRFLGPRDPKLLSYPLMDNVLPTVIFSCLYLIFVLFIGPVWMKNRKPFVLRTPLLIYNLLMMIVNCWFVASFIIYGWNKYNWRCEPMDFSSSERAIKMSEACWWAYISKLVEYCDTIFFVLRKKDSQVNFLHVFHHSTVPVTTWFGVNYGPSGFNMIFPLVNSFIHIWMYMYYGLSALGPGIQKYLWWKKYLTKLQLAQFVFVTGYFCQLYLFPKENCEVSPFLFLLSCGQAVLYLVLFTNFYFRSYRKSQVKTGKDNAHNAEKQNGNKQNGNKQNGNSNVKRTKQQ